MQKWGDRPVSIRGFAWPPHFCIFIKANTLNGMHILFCYIMTQSSVCPLSFIPSLCVLAHVHTYKALVNQNLTVLLFRQGSWRDCFLFLYLCFSNCSFLFLVTLLYSMCNIRSDKPIPCIVQLMWYKLVHVITLCSNRLAEILLWHLQAQGKLNSLWLLILDFWF